MENYGTKVYTGDSIEVVLSYMLVPELRDADPEACWPFGNY